MRFVATTAQDPAKVAVSDGGQPFRGPQRRQFERDRPVRRTTLRCRANWLRHRRAGFTLLELVLVLTIIALLLAAVAPALSGFATGRRPGEAAAEFVALTRLARSNAIAQGRTYRVLCDPTRGRWWMANDHSGTAPAPGPLGEVFHTPSGVRLATNAPLINGLPTLQFMPDGRCQPAEVEFLSGQGTVRVACTAPTETFHVVTGGGPSP